MFEEIEEEPETEKTPDVEIILEEPASFTDKLAGH